jgi:hypothetical protein
MSGDESHRIKGALMDSEMPKTTSRCLLSPSTSVQSSPTSVRIRLDHSMPLSPINPFLEQEIEINSSPMQMLIKKP